VPRPAAVGELQTLLAQLVRETTRSRLKVLGGVATDAKTTMTKEQLVDEIVRKLNASPIAGVSTVLVDAGHAMRGLAGDPGTWLAREKALALQSVMEAVQRQVGGSIRVLWVVDGVNSQLDTKHLGRLPDSLGKHRHDMLNAVEAGLRAAGVKRTPDAAVFHEVMVAPGEADPTIAYMCNQGRACLVEGVDTDILMYATSDILMFNASRSGDNRVVTAADFFQTYASQLDLVGDITPARRGDLQALAMFHAAIAGCDALICRLRGVGVGKSMAAISKVLGGQWQVLKLLANGVRANAGLPEGWVDAYLNALPRDLQPLGTQRGAVKSIMAHSFHHIVNHAVANLDPVDIGGGGGAGGVAASAAAALPGAVGAASVPAAPVVAAFPVPGVAAGAGAALPVAAPAAGMDGVVDVMHAPGAAAGDVPAPAADPADGGAVEAGGGGAGASLVSTLKDKVCTHVAKSKLPQGAAGGGAAAAASALSEAAGGGGHNAADVVAPAATAGLPAPDAVAAAGGDAVAAASTSSEAAGGGGHNAAGGAAGAAGGPAGEGKIAAGEVDEDEGAEGDEDEDNDGKDELEGDAIVTSQPAGAGGGGVAVGLAMHAGPNRPLAAPVPPRAHAVAAVAVAPAGVAAPVPDRPARGPAAPCPVVGIVTNIVWQGLHSQPAVDEETVRRLVETVRKMAPAAGEPADLLATLATDYPDKVLPRALLAQLEAEHREGRLHESLLLPFLMTQAVLKVQQAVEKAGVGAVHAARTGSAMHPVDLYLQRGTRARIRLFCTTSAAAGRAADAFTAFVDRARDETVLRELQSTTMPDHPNFHRGDAVAAVNAIGRAVVCLLRQQLQMPRGGDGVLVNMRVPGGQAGVGIPASLAAHEPFVRGVMMEAAEACRDVCWRSDAALREAILANVDPRCFEHVCVAVHAAGEAAAASAHIDAGADDADTASLRFHGCWIGGSFYISLHVKRGATQEQRDAVLEAMAAKLRDLQTQRACLADPVGATMRRAMRDAAGGHLASSSANAAKVYVTSHDGTRVVIWVKRDTPQAVRSSIRAAGHAAWSAAHPPVSDPLDRNHVAKAVQAAVTRAAAVARARDGAARTDFPTQYVTLTELTTAVHALTAGVELGVVERIVWCVMPGGKPHSFNCPDSDKPAVVAAAAATLLSLINQVGAALLDESLTPSSVRLVNWCRPGTPQGAIASALTAARDAAVASPFHRIHAFYQALALVPYFPDSPYAFGAPDGIANIAKLKDELRNKRWLEVHAIVHQLVKLHWSVLHARLSGLLACPMPSSAGVGLAVTFTPDGGDRVRFLIPADGGEAGEAVWQTFQLAAHRIEAVVRACWLAKNANNAAIMAGDVDAQVLLVAARAVAAGRPLFGVLLESFHVSHALRLDVWKIFKQSQFAADGVLGVDAASGAQLPAGWTSDPADLPAAAAGPVVTMLRPFTVKGEKSSVMALIAPSGGAATKVSEALDSAFKPTTDRWLFRTSSPEVVAGRRLDILCPLAIALRAHAPGNVAAAAADADAAGGGGGDDAACAAGGAGAVADRRNPRWTAPWPAFAHDTLSPDDAALLERLFPPTPVAAPAAAPVADAVAAPAAEADAAPAAEAVAAPAAEADAAPAAEAVTDPADEAPAERAAKRPRWDGAADAGVGGGGAAVVKRKQHTGTVADLVWLAPLITAAAPPAGGAGGGGAAAGAGAGKRR
jgi:hypothetical protein